MPAIIDTPYRDNGSLLTSEQSDDTSPFAMVSQEHQEQYRERYPEGLNLIPGSPDHDRLVNEVMRRAHESESYVGPRHKDWREVDKSLTAYIPTTEAEDKVREKDSRKPISIVIPESYATRETLVTYNMSVFGTPPFFRYEGVGPEDTLGAILMEHINQNQVRKGKAMLAIHTFFNDIYTYGVGILVSAWHTKTGRRTRAFDRIGFDAFGNEFVEGVERVVEDTVLFEGTVLSAVDPYLYLPDPAVNLYEVQEGEFVGWKEETTYMQALREEQEPGSLVFNTRYTRSRPMESAIFKSDSSGRNEKTQLRDKEGRTSSSTQVCDKIYMHIDLIPREWKIGESERPEKWLFCVNGDRVLTRAEPTDYNHDMFPVSVATPDYGGHELMPVSKLEMMHGLQGVINWYFNSHVANVRKSINDMLIVDPKSVNMNDVYSQEPGKVIRTRKNLWGRGVDGVVEQLKVQDVTQNHIADMHGAMDISRNTTGAVDSVKGLQRQRGERVTKAEFQDTRNSALSRLQKSAQIISLQAFDDLALIYAMNTQQFMTQETYVKTVGRWEGKLREEYGITDPFIPVNALDLDIAFDVVSRDGSIENSSDPDAWINLFNYTLQSPQVLQSVDMTRVWLHIARLLGEKNAHEFLLSGRPVQQQIVPDEQAFEGAATGRLQAV